MEMTIMRGICLGLILLVLVPAILLALALNWVSARKVPTPPGMKGRMQDFRPFDDEQEPDFVTPERHQRENI